MTFAKEHDMLESFNNTFSRLENYLANGYTVTLYGDFAPLSMEISMTKNDKFILYGALFFMGHMMVIKMVVFQLCFNHKIKREPEKNPTLSFSASGKRGSHVVMPTAEPTTLSLGSRALH